MIEKITYWISFFILYKNSVSLIIDRIRRTNSRIVILRNGYKLKASKDSPLTIVMDETFILKRYTPNFLKIESGDIVVDIGAHVGDFSILASLKNAKNIFSYEPDPNTFLLLKHNVSSNNVKNIKCINFAISNKNKLSDFYINKFDGGSSLIKTSDSLKKVIVKNIILNEVFEQNKISKIDFLKIDCEGAEGLIFKSTKDNTWNRINKISLEYHNNVSVLKSNELLSILKRNKFKTKELRLDKNFGYIYAWK